MPHLEQNPNAKAQRRYKAGVKSDLAEIKLALADLKQLVLASVSSDRPPDRLDEVDQGHQKTRKAKHG
jgi:hypothetical protein